MIKTIFIIVLMASVVTIIEKLMRAYRREKKDWEEYNKRMAKYKHD